MLSKIREVISSAARADNTLASLMASATSARSAAVSADRITTNFRVEQEVR